MTAILTLPVCCLRSPTLGLRLVVTALSAYSRRPTVAALSNTLPDRPSCL